MLQQPTSVPREHLRVEKNTALPSSPQEQPYNTQYTLEPLQRDFSFHLFTVHPKTYSTGGVTIHHSRLYQAQQGKRLPTYTFPPPWKPDADGTSRASEAEQIELGWQYIHSIRPDLLSPFPNFAKPTRLDLLYLTKPATWVVWRTVNPWRTSACGWCNQQ